MRDPFITPLTIWWDTKIDLIMEDGSDAARKDNIFCFNNRMGGCIKVGPAMKVLHCICLVSLIAGVVLGQEPMTSDQFRKLVDTPGDMNALRPELASLPFWRNAKCSVSLKYQDGRVFKEVCMQTAKTVGGRYIVFSTDSQLYKQPMHAIAGYDEKASAIRQWGLFGDTLTEATMIFDPERKICASMATYAGGFSEISVGSHSETEMSDHALVYKDGVLFMIRDVKTWPIDTPTKLEQDGAANGSQPIRSETNKTPPVVAPAGMK